MSRTIGAFVFPAVLETWAGDTADRMLRSLQDFGVNTIVTESERYDDHLIERAHRLGLRFVGGISCFSDHSNQDQILKQRPELWPILEDGSRRPQMEWYIGVTPTFSDYNEARLDEIERIVSRHDLDGFYLDFIRWPLHWELELRPNAGKPLQSSFDAHTLSRFQAHAQIELPASADVPALADWILGQHRAAWTDFKCQVITDFVRQARGRVRSRRDTAMEFGVYLVPAPDDQRAELVGQRVADLKPLVDAFAPMVYHAILHRDVVWAATYVGDLLTSVPGQVLPVVQVDSAEGAESGADWGPPISADEWQSLVQAMLRLPGSPGMVAFTGTALFQDRRGKILGASLAQE